MEVSYLVEGAILVAILLVGGMIKRSTRRMLKSMDGSQGLIKKKDAKGKIISRG